MKAISVRQPWARCIANGKKTVENRGRPTVYRGLVAIHASKTPDRRATEDPRVVRALGFDPLLGTVLGAVVAVADLVDCHESRDCCWPWGEMYHFGPTRTVPAWHLVLTDVRRLGKPVPVRGSLAVPWNLPEAVAEAVAAQLAGVAR